jgi:hypothetical protein
MRTSVRSSATARSLVTIQMRMVARSARFPVMSRPQLRYVLIRWSPSRRLTLASCTPTVRLATSWMLGSSPTAS